MLPARVSKPLEAVFDLVSAREVDRLAECAVVPRERVVSVRPSERPSGEPAVDDDGVGVDLEVGELSVFTAQPSGDFVTQAGNDEG